MSTNDDDLVFTALCDRFRSLTNIRRTMTREELQRATGLDPEVLDETLKALRGPDAHDDSYVAFEGLHMNSPSPRPCTGPRMSPLAIGLPHCGHVGAASETSRLQSGQVMRGMMDGSVGEAAREGHRD